MKDSILTITDYNLLNFHPTRTRSLIMDFKERFKGRTTNMKKEGFMETFAATTNPVTKSQSNSQLPSASKISSTVTYDFQGN